MRISAIIIGSNWGAVPSHEGGPAEKQVQPAHVKWCHWRTAALGAWALILPLT